jgi:hypothetical protein
MGPVWVGPYHCALQIQAILLKLLLLVLPGFFIHAIALALCVECGMLLSQELDAGQKFLGVLVKEWRRAGQTSR